ncbi:MAG: BrnT family toxin [Gammaproteobacteria bacterium]
MEYDWDPHKRLLNIRKHGIDFVDATLVFEDERALTIEDESHMEERFITIGADAQGNILVVVYTHRLNHIRIISARKATKFEIRSYYGGL